MFTVTASQVNLLDTDESVVTFYAPNIIHYAQISQLLINTFFPSSQIPSGDFEKDFFVSLKSFSESFTSNEDSGQGYSEAVTKILYNSQNREILYNLLTECFDFPDPETQVYRLNDLCIISCLSLIFQTFTDTLNQTVETT
jgi:hypothetical protein